MTYLFKKAIKKTIVLLDVEQDNITQVILDDIEDKGKLNLQFKNSQDNLSVLADMAIKDYKAGKTNELNVF